MKISRIILTLLVCLCANFVAAQEKDGPVLLMPTDQVSISSNTAPVFYWLREERAPVGSFYQIRIFEEDVSLNDTRFRFPLIDKELKEGDHFEWPAAGAQIEAGKTYSWTVRLLDNNRNVLGTGWVEPYVFHVRDETLREWSYQTVVPEGVEFTAAGTGASTGVVAIVTVGNSSAHPVELQIGPYVIPSAGKYQSYLVPQRTRLSLLPNESKALELEGYCLDVFKQPLPFGADLPPVSEWVRPNPDREIILTELSKASKEWSWVEAQNVYDKYWYLSKAYVFYRFYEQIFTPYQNNPDYERNMVLQHALWKSAGKIKDQLYGKKDLTRIIKKQQGFSDWRGSSDVKESQIKKEIEAIWRAIEQVEHKAEYLMGTSKRFRDSYHPDLSELLNGKKSKEDNPLVLENLMGGDLPMEGRYQWTDPLWDRVELVGSSVKPRQEKDTLPWVAIGAVAVASATIGAIIVRSSSGGDCTPEIDQVDLRGDVVICSGENAMVSALGDCPDCTFEWSNGTTGRVLETNIPGSYSVNVNDALGCLRILYCQLGPEPAPDLELSFEEPLLICNGRENLPITIATCNECDVYVNGTLYEEEVFQVQAPGSYLFKVTTPCGTENEEILQVVQQDFSMQLFGDRSFCADQGTTLKMQYSGEGNPDLFYYWNGLLGSDTMFFDAQGLVKAELRSEHCAVAVFDDLEEFSFGDFSIDGDRSFCVDGSTNLQVVGGENCLGCTYQWNYGLSGENVTASVPGTYFVNVSNLNGCYWTDTILVTYQPELDLEIVGPSTLCFGSVDSLKIEGDCEGCSYSWSVSSSESSIPITGPGSYGLIATNNLGCSWSGSYVVENPEQPVLDFSGNTSICEGGSTSLAMVGSCPNCEFEWSNGDVGVIGTYFSTGTASVEVTDGIGCQWSFSTEITGSSMLDLQLEGSTLICAGSSTELSIEGACNGCTYDWSNGLTSASIEVSQPGVYSVSVSNPNDCFWSSSVNVTQIDNLELEVVGESTICPGQVIELAVQGNCPACTYQWTNGGPASPIQEISAPGIYTVLVNNEAGCNWVGSTNISISEQPSMTLILDAEDCLDGDVTISAIPVCQSCDYLWSTGSTEQTIEVSETDDYSLTLTSDEGCTNTQEISVIDYPALDLNVLVNQPSCAGADGSAFVELTPDPSLYTVTWEDGTEGQFHGGLSESTTFSIENNQITCSETTLVNIENSGGPIQTSIETEPPTIVGGADGNATIVLLGDVTAPFIVYIGDFSYQTNQPVINLVGLESKIYIINIEDADGCETGIIIIDFTEGKPAPINPVVQWNIENDGFTNLETVRPSAWSDEDIPVITNVQTLHFSMEMPFRSNRWGLAVNYDFASVKWRNGLSTFEEESEQHIPQLGLFWKPFSTDILKLKSQLNYSLLQNFPDQSNASNASNASNVFYPSVSFELENVSRTKILSLRWNGLRTRNVWSPAVFSLDAKMRINR